ncbi:hypothetical protein [Streptomyces sp. NRRL F-5650]|uniref:hypothetical protein n=1 Tax=Streptomyces sp. NRRL F-5650 TaxID=1463868 RepID=UPI0004C69E5B|nr:hypothetical protein [Streptomyces sp. NRRL F-5650]
MGLADWGDVPTWFSGVGALTAGWFAYQTIRSQRRQIGEQRAFIAEQTRFMDEQRQNLELERAELRAQAEERRVSQARQIHMAFTTWGSSGEDRYGDGTGYSAWRVEVENKSNEPIRDVTVRFGETYIAATATDEQGFHHPDGGRRLVPVPLIPAGHKVVFESPNWSEATVDNNRPALLFTDDGGVLWRRDSYGKLEEVPADGAS